MNELSIVVVMSIAAVLWAAMTYSVGYREGQREGYIRGKSVGRHVSLAKRTVLESIEKKAAK